MTARWGEGTLIHGQCGCKNNTATVENDESSLRNENLCYHLTQPNTIKCTPKRTQHIKDNCTLKIIKQFTTAEMQDQLMCPSVNGWRKNRWCVHIMEYSQPPKSEILTFVATWMELDG